MQIGDRQNLSHLHANLPIFLAYQLKTFRNTPDRSRVLLISRQPCCSLHNRPKKRPGIEPRAMSKVSKQEYVSILAGAKNGLVYLTANDWALIADKAATTQFKSGDRLVHKDRTSPGVHLLLKGTASIEIGGTRKSSTIGPGEICGEISFLDELPATADVVATGVVESYFLDRATLQSMFELFPHLGSRFYRSLATILSRRLRGMIAAQSATKAAIPDLS